MASGVFLTLLLTLCIGGLKPSWVSGATESSDASALNVMYESLNSPPQLSQWTPTGGDPCGQSWKGITCSGSRVTEIKLSGLGLRGSLGYQLASLTSVTEMDMSNNNLNGSIPYQLPPNLQRLNLANNQFTGNFPYSISQMSSLTYINMGHNQLQGQLGDIFANLSSLSTLDLSFNMLSGYLPRTFHNLTSMTSMYLQNNQFSGTIDVLATLPLENLDISNNQFAGWIPESLKGINLHSNGNTWNSGPAPPPPPGTPPLTGRTHKHKSESSRQNGDNSESISDSGNEAKKSGIGAGAIAGIVISVLIVGAIVAFFLLKRRKRKPSLDVEKFDKPSLDVEKFDKHPFASVTQNDGQDGKSSRSSSGIDSKALDSSVPISLPPPPAERHRSFDADDLTEKPVIVKKPITLPSNVKAYSIADLQMATGSFTTENLLGEGSFGRVYRAQFDDGKVVAVKKIDSSVLPPAKSGDFLEMVSQISQLRHPNVTELLGYCSEHAQHLLVYEFHKNGSLHDFLHLSDEHSKPLIWNLRVKIALGTARALEYLHEVFSPSVVHKNIKSANILLDGELSPHLSDSAIASTFPDADEILSRDEENTGYSAPEVAMSGQYSLKGDIYSFGVVMLELLTGRKPFDSTRPRAEQSLVRWATPQLHDIDALGKMVDPALEGLYPVKSLSRFADIIALCVQLEPEFRPPMSEVVQSLLVLVQRANMSKRTVGLDQGHRAISL